MLVIVVSYNLQQIRELRDKVVWLEGGEVRAWEGAPGVLDQYESSLRG